MRQKVLQESNDKKKGRKLDIVSEVMSGTVADAIWKWQSLIA